MSLANEVRKLRIELITELHGAEEACGTDEQLRTKADLCIERVRARLKGHSWRYAKLRQKIRKLRRLETELDLVR